MADKTDKGEPAGQIACNFAKETPSPDLYDKMITIVVGPVGSEKSFSVYRRLLCSASKYFDNMLNGGFAESGSHTLRQADVEVRPFQCFYYWLNSGVVDCLTSSPNQTEVRENIVDAYALADFYVVPKLKNALVYCLYDHAERTNALLLPTTLKIYEVTKEGDLVLDLVVDMTAKSYGFKDFETLGSVFPQAFLFSLLCALKKYNITPGGKGFKSKPYRADMEAHFCERYHDHSVERNGKRTADEAFDSA